MKTSKKNKHIIKIMLTQKRMFIEITFFSFLIIDFLFLHKYKLNYAENIKITVLLIYKSYLIIRHTFLVI
jgi:hypothetical protein